jgi:hypothetical protein
MPKSSPGNWWSLGDAEATDVGHVTISVSDTNLGRATAVFTVAQLPAATYQLMLCDTACTEPLADVIPTENFTVVASEFAADVRLGIRRVAGCRDAGRSSCAARPSSPPVATAATRPRWRVAPQRRRGPGAPLLRGQVCPIATASPRTMQHWSLNGLQCRSRCGASVLLRRDAGLNHRCLALGLIR